MKKKVLFVCIHNSARSQMAEAFLNTLGKDYFEAESAGLEPGTLNQDVVKVMKEQKIDISNNKTKSVFDFYNNGKTYDFVITVCDESNGERCPIFPGKVSRLHFGFEDPSSISGNSSDSLQKIRDIRDQIKNKIEQFIKDNK